MVSRTFRGALVPLLSGLLAAPTLAADIVVPGGAGNGQAGQGQVGTISGPVPGSNGGVSVIPSPGLGLAPGLGPDAAPTSLVATPLLAVAPSLPLKSAAQILSEPPVPSPSGSLPRTGASSGELDAQNVGAKTGSALSEAGLNGLYDGAAPTPTALLASLPPAGLFGRSSPAMEEVLHHSDPDRYLFIPSRSDVPNLDPPKRQKVLSIRALVQAVVRDEELLRRFVHLDDRLMRQADYIPTLVGDIVRKIGVTASEADIYSWSDIFSRSDRRTIHWYIVNPRSPNPYEAIVLYADEYFGTQHTLQSVDRAKKIMRGYFPGLYKEFPFQAQVEAGHFAWSSEETSHFLREDGSHVFKLNIGTALKPSPGQPASNPRVLDDLDTQGLFKNGHLFRRRIADLIAMLHEYAHGIYEETVGYQPTPLSPGYYNTVDAAFNEGFAVLIEMLAGQKMEQDAEKLKLDQRDVEDLREFRRQRIQYLHGNFRDSRSPDESVKRRGLRGMAYTEGTVKLLHKIYKKGGIEGVRDFLLSIDRNKTLTTLRTSPEYAALLRNPGKPDYFLKGSSRVLVGMKP